MKPVNNSILNAFFFLSMTNIYATFQIGKAQGKGIFLFRNIKEIGSWKNTYRYNPDNP